MNEGSDEIQERLNNGVLLVIVGAGASYDCLPEADLRNRDTEHQGLRRRPASAVRPPLTKDLVEPGALQNELVVRYERCRPVVDELRYRLLAPSAEGVAPTLEQALLDYQERADYDPTIYSHLTAFRFYLRDLLWAATDYMLSADLTGGVTNYTKLVRVLRSWATLANRHVCIVSFNYDLLLDQACHDQWGLNPFDLATYVGDPYMTLVKPHGSVHWAWQLPNQPEHVVPWEAPGRAIATGRPTIPDGSPIKVISSPPYRESMTSISVTIPALALPMPFKAASELIWPPEQAALFDSLETRVRRLLVIGWRGAEAEIVDRLKRMVMSRARIGIVSGGPNAERDGRETSGNIGLFGREEDRTSKGFSGLFDSQLLDWLLEDIVWPWP